MRRHSGALLLILLACGALATLLTLTGSLRERLYQEHLDVAMVALRSAVMSIGHARQLGVPLEHMIGIEELLDSRKIADLGVGAVRILDGRGKLVWHNPVRPSGSAQMLELSIGADARLQAEFVPPEDTMLLARVAVMLIAVMIALSLPLLELARFADLIGETFAADCLARQLEAVRRGDFRIAWRPVGVGGGDARVHFLRDQVFLLNEQYQRVTRLIGSLQRTEPVAARRNQLGELLAELAGRFRFAGMGGPLDRRVWPSAGTAHCFAVLTLVLANLSIGSGGSSAYSPTSGTYSLLAALSAWSLGALAGRFAAGAHWTVRLRAGILIAAIANLVMINGALWSDVLGHFAGGLATSLAATAAMEADRAHVRRVTAVMLLSATMGGPVLGLAATAALSSFVTVSWIFGAAALLSMMTAGWLAARLVSESVPRGRAPTQRLPAGAVMAGVAWSAAVVVFIAGASSDREQALRLVILQMPGFLLLAALGGNERLAVAARASLTIGLAAVGLAQLLGAALPAVAHLLNLDHLSWAGALLAAGAVAMPRGCPRNVAPARTVAGFAAGALVTCIVAAATGWATPSAREAVTVAMMLVALLVGALLPASTPSRVR